MARKGKTIDAAATLWRVAVYIRLSREDGNDESESVTNQKKILTEYMRTYFDGPHTVVDFYIDDGLTGTDDTRADFMRMIQDIEQGRVNCVLCKTLARAFRNYSDQGYYLEYYFPQKKVRFISTGDPKIDTFTNPEAITGLEVPITGLMNDRFAGRTSSDVRRTFDTKRRNGEFIGAFPPYGYLKDPEDKNRLVIDPEILPIKRDIRDWILHEGLSLSGAAQRLNERGIPNPTAYKRGKGWRYSNPHAAQNDGLWTGPTVKRMLLDPVNLGHMVQGKQRVVSYKVHEKVAVPKDEWFVAENTHEATFTQEEYDSLSRLLARDTRTPNGQRTVHLLAGFLFCADCGKALQRKSAKGTVYYACRTYTEKLKSRCTKHSIRADALEAAVLAAVQTQVVQVDNLAGLLNETAAVSAMQPQHTRVEKMLADKRRELEKARAVSDSLYADWKMGEITHEAYRRMKGKYQDLLRQLTGALEALEAEQQRMLAEAASPSEALVMLQKQGNVPALDRAIVTVLIDTIRVHENKAVTIRFLVADGWLHAAH